MKISLSELAALIGGEVCGDASKKIYGVAPFELARDGEITAAGNVKFLKNLGASNAGAFIVPRKATVGSKHLLLVDDPMIAFAKVIRHFHPPDQPPAGIHPKAEVGQDFKSGEGASVGPFVTIGDRVAFGDRVWLHAGVYIGDDVVIGDDVTIYPNVTVLARCTIGNRVIIHSGSVIGSDGFGFAPDGKVYHKIPHTGFVQIDDDVEIGANNTIDRGTFGKTLIGRGVKTDNLVQIAHNVTIGENTVLVAQVGISGSTKIGKNAILAGQAGVAGHLTIGDGATIGPQTGVGKPVANGQVVMAGLPEMPYKTWLRVQRTIPMLPELKKRLDNLEKKLEAKNEKQ
jgi:UDP-3-O-[3-hydroxymyristoyl] glucosamine N-acyltransferase